MTAHLWVLAKLSFRFHMPFEYLCIGWNLLMLLFFIFYISSDALVTITKDNKLFLWVQPEAMWLVFPIIFMFLCYITALWLTNFKLGTKCYNFFPQLLGWEVVIAAIVLSRASVIVIVFNVYTIFYCSCICFSWYSCIFLFYYGGQYGSKLGGVLVWLKMLMIDTWKWRRNGDDCWKLVLLLRLAYTTLIHSRNVSLAHLYLPGGNFLRDETKIDCESRNRHI